jgi:large subunit ribosomal protein L4e
MSRNGTQMNWVGAFVSGTVGGRRAHHPKAEKIWSLSVNEKERKKAIRSCLSATMLKDLVQKRGHMIPDSYPFVVEDKIQDVSKTKEVKKILDNIGLKDELARVSERFVRAGHGKSRGRKYKSKNGPLLVVGKDCKLLKAAANIPGVDVIKASNVNCEILAPGSRLGRLTIFTEDALKSINQNKLFV